MWTKEVRLLFSALAASSAWASVVPRAVPRMARRSRRRVPDAKSTWVSMRACTAGSPEAADTHCTSLFCNATRASYQSVVMVLPSVPPARKVYGMLAGTLPTAAGRLAVTYSKATELNQSMIACRSARTV
ncbi:hypothetical protein D3C79_870300 [compost metagenome]